MRQALCVFPKHRARVFLLGKLRAAVYCRLLETVLPCSGAPQIFFAVFVQDSASNLDLLLKRICWVMLAASLQSHHPSRAAHCALREACGSWQNLAQGLRKQACKQPCASRALRTGSVACELRLWPCARSGSRG